MNKKPKWLVLGEEITHIAFEEAMSPAHNLSALDLQVRHLPQLSLQHLAACLDLSIEANRKGCHSAALCLLRQCVEALTIAELGLQDAKYAEPLLFGWLEGRKTQGELRQNLEKDIWPAYGRGLWEESWSEFFGNLARAVQPYAHYTPLLQGWQWVTVKSLSDTSWIAGFGPGSYDPLKASRITLLHTLVGWTLARIVLARGKSAELVRRKEDIFELGHALARSNLLFKGKDWATQLIPHMLFKPGHSYEDDYSHSVNVCRE